VIVHTVRLPGTKLPASAKLGDHFCVVNGALVPVKMDADKLRRYEVRLRLRRNRRLRLRPKTFEAFDRLLREDYQFLIDNGYFKKD
jgi:hypothetical protein